MPRIFHLAIGCPHPGQLHTDMALSVSSLTVAMSQHRMPGWDANAVSFIFVKTSLLAKARQEIIDQALRAKCTHLLFVDSDQVFPNSIVHRLARHKQPVVACNVATKVLPSSPTARSRNEVWAGGDPVFSKGKKGIEKVWRIGTGVVLLDLSIISGLRRPLFNTEWRDEINDYCGEDWFFCERLEDAGIPIFVDHDVSQEIGHIGHFTFTHDHIQEPEK